MLEWPDEYEPAQPHITLQSLLPKAQNELASRVEYFLRKHDFLVRPCLIPASPLLHCLASPRPKEEKNKVLYTNKDDPLT